ncbi:MAG: hypothetical protein P4L98_19690, partial [Ancalomicrobiaceae bacterium]|nr:hypothetical protein [Ancalomicrobiaceae bacterium]
MVEPKPDEYHRRFVGPAEALERSIAAAPNDLSLWIELIVHYWVMTETGVVCALGAPGPLMWQACTRRQQLLAAAKERFGAAPRL